jgi:hypothetical protein
MQNAFHYRSILVWDLQAWVPAEQVVNAGSGERLLEWATRWEKKGLLA